MNRPPHLRFTYWTLLGAAVVVALGLAGCGRKGPLDLPPAAAAPPPQGAAPKTAAAVNPLTARSEPKAPPAFNHNGQPVAPPGPKVHLPLDWLID